MNSLLSFDARTIAALGLQSKGNNQETPTFDALFDIGKKKMCELYSYNKSFLNGAIIRSDLGFLVWYLENGGSVADVFDPWLKNLSENYKLETFSLFSNEGEFLKILLTQHCVENLDVVASAAALHRLFPGLHKWINTLEETGKETELTRFLKPKLLISVKNRFRTYISHVAPSDQLSMDAIKPIITNLGEHAIVEHLEWNKCLDYAVNMLKPINDKLDSEKDKDIIHSIIMFAYEERAIFAVEAMLKLKLFEGKMVPLFIHYAKEMEIEDPSLDSIIMSLLDHKSAYNYIYLVSTYPQFRMFNDKCIKSCKPHDFALPNVDSFKWEKKAMYLHYANPNRTGKYGGCPVFTMHQLCSVKDIKNIVVVINNLWFGVESEETNGDLVWSVVEYVEKQTNMVTIKHLEHLEHNVTKHTLSVHWTNVNPDPKEKKPPANVCNVSQSVICCKEMDKENKIIAKNVDLPYVKQDFEYIQAFWTVMHWFVFNKDKFGDFFFKS
jgi:hypothetical protein